MKIDNKVWVNKRFVDIDKAAVSVFDRGFLYGDGVFETMRCYAGVVFSLDEHLKRLYSSLRAALIRPPVPRKRLEALIYKTVHVNKVKSAYVRVAVTRGEGRLAIGHMDTFDPTLVIIAKRFDDYPAWMHDKGVSAVIASTRQNEYTILSRIKSHNFMNYILARSEAQERGYDEAIILNTKAQVVEAVTSNIFLVKGRTIITPALVCGVLPGITRATVLEIARRLRFRVKEKAVTPNELLNADEVFFTNSLAEILPVRKIGRRRIGSGRPGQTTQLLRICYQKEVIKAVLR